jgi:5-methylcytosine-specific restriction endonuclease McrA
MSAILLLNANSEPLGTIPIKKAISLLGKDRVDVVRAVPNRYLRSQYTTQPLPSVMRLKYYVNVPRRKISWSRRAVFSRDNYTCVYCGEKLSYEKATIDTWGNTVTACEKCNRRKANRSLQDSGMHFKDENYEPRTPRTNYLIVSSNIPEEWKAYLRI